MGTGGAVGGEEGHAQFLSPDQAHGHIQGDGRGEEKGHGRVGHSAAPQLRGRHFFPYIMATMPRFIACRKIASAT